MIPTTTMIYKTFDDARKAYEAEHPDKMASDEVAPYRSKELPDGNIEATRIQGPGPIGSTGKKSLHLRHDTELTKKELDEYALIITEDWKLIIQ